MCIYLSTLLSSYTTVLIQLFLPWPGPSAPAASMDFSQALTNTWIGETGDLYETGYTSLPKNVDDDNFHKWRFDWHTDTTDRRVEFYLDGEHVRTMRNDNIPFYAGRLWIGEYAFYQRRQVAHAFK